MDPAQLATEACQRFAALHSATPSSTSVTALAGGVPSGPALGGPAAEPLLEAFQQLGTLDGWAKISMARLAAEPQDGRAHQELRRSLEQMVRLHPHFMRRLADVLADRPAVKTSLSNTGSLPLQQLRSRG